MTAFDWSPSASLEALKARASILNAVRRFFAERGVLEVETPAMGRYTGTDPCIDSISVLFNYPGQAEERCYLQTSPEFAMKRLLAAGIGSIYQISKVFRNGERGRYHNPEFTMLEWYRPGFTYQDLMGEVLELLEIVLGCQAVEWLTYQEAFLKVLGVDPFTASINELTGVVKQQGTLVDFELSRDGWLQLIMSHYIEPQLGQNGQPTFVYDFPASQAALAAVSEVNPLVAERFEVYVNGIELANGFRELTDAQEQRRRFEHDLKLREEQGLRVVPLDEYLLCALSVGLPESSGVALGFDRLVMLALGMSQIQDVITFDFGRV